MTLEGERLTADDIVVRRDMVAAARIDTFGVRLSFVVVAGLFLANLVASVAAFLETLQFFEPDYTLFALSMLPLVGLGYTAFRLRPRQHFTLTLRDGSALGVLSRDGNFLTRCLEAFERLWSDPMRAKSSLYVHSAHRSVDFGPPAGGIDVLANTPDDEPVALTLPVFGDDDDDESSDELTSEHPDRDKEDGRHDLELPPLPPLDEDDAPADDETAHSDLPEIEAETHVSSALEADDPVDDAPDDEGDDGPLPPSPPPFPVLEGDEAEKGAEESNDMAVESDAEIADEQPQSGEEIEADSKKDRPFGDHVGVPAAAFVDVRPKVEALVRLLRERAPAQGISDAVDVLELMTRRGCDTPVEVRALARSVDLLRERMRAYPTAIDLLDTVDQVGHLKDHPAVRETSRGPRNG